MSGTGGNLLPKKKHKLLYMMILLYCGPAAVTQQRFKINLIFFFGLYIEMFNE